MDNEFLEELLKLQQDGSGAISAPPNWRREPLLEVETHLDPVIDDLCKSVLPQAQGKRIGRWHFFVGSPGNGKSAAVGKLARKLTEGGLRICTEEGLNLNALPEGDVPYLLELREAEAPYEIGWLAQDASVLRDPFSQDANPAEQLIGLLERASEKGVSLVVCTNRGVIENAFRRVYLDRERNGTSWFRALKCAVGDGRSCELPFDGDSKRKVFDQFHVTHTQLDSRSLLINSDIFEKLVQNATHGDRWQPCGQCPVRGYCPFHANMAWLSHDPGRASLLTVLRRAELLSGQIVGFREALAVLSLVLAGCPRDYVEGTPCRWVRQRVGEGDFFSLLSRRIYMTLFSAYSPLGLEHVGQLAGDQGKYLAHLMDDIGEGAEDRTALAHVLRTNGVVVSTDVGASRLLGASGVFPRLDPLMSPLPPDIGEHWDGTIPDLREDKSCLISLLERKCLGLWHSLEARIERSSEESVERYRWLRRWMSAFTYRLGAFMVGHTSFGPELDELLEITTFREGRPLQSRDMERLMSLEGQLERLLNQMAEEGVDLSDCVTLAGTWVRERLRPTIAKKPSTKHIGLVVSFGERDEFPVSADVFIWLKKKLDDRMSGKSFPDGLLEAARDKQVRAASKSDYAYQDQGVELVVRCPNGARIKMKRYMGEVLI